ncbi:MAG: hypothetical protein GY913_07150 [Proteobacteria bacterium]|nr:hypothetical protein [Pseudomonadota bacterium]MCP4916685.1 hypothetical protein [Pseudomonadota bacterium]
MPASFQTRIELFAPRERLYSAWLSSSDQTTITGAAAMVEPRVGGGFSLWEGSVVGQIVFLAPNARIAQTWRTHDFGDHVPDSRLEITFEPTQAGTRMSIIQDRIPQKLHPQFVYAWTKVYLPALSAWTATTVSH